MCGRTTHDMTWEEIWSLYTFGKPPKRDQPNSYHDSWNVAPTTINPVCRLDKDGERDIAMLRWGLVPIWAKNLKFGMSCINARDIDEKGVTIAERPAFRAAFKSRRCLVPANLFYEWQAQADPELPKRPYAIGLRDGTPMTFAGLWESWHDAVIKEPTPEDWVHTYTIATTSPNALMAQLHNRMPVILAPEDWPAWLGEVETTREQRLALLRPYPAEEMTAWPVTTDVNNSRNNRPDLIVPIGEPLAA
ncbi:SOS response-associated peptidase [Inquilinus sp. OTU3971]|uniref:SOS response-associated peptidase n=1 Tax=Inquilinus sp. OTU3971 TaxID=3043855 RepID=UPI00313AB6F8